MLLAELMALEAASAGLFAGQGLEANDLSYVPASFGMRLSWTMASLATLILHATVVDRRLPMGAVVVGVGNILVAGSAGVGASVE